jgi:hypothetical protein
MRLLEGRVLRVDRVGLLVERGGRQGDVRRSWSEVGAVRMSDEQSVRQPSDRSAAGRLSSTVVASGSWTTTVAVRSRRVQDRWKRTTPAT